VSAPVAVAVVSWNTRELLAGCLESLRADHDSGRAEVWVVDNASGDGSAEMVRARFPWVELIASERNLGFGAAANLVAGRTESPWVAPANADIALEAGALETMLDRGSAVPRAGAVAPRLVAPSGETQHSVHSFPSVRVGLAFNLRLARAVPGLGDRLCIEGYWDPERRRRVDWAHGAFMLLRRRAFAEVGGFDARLWMYAEDLDLCWRLRRAGWDTLYEPAARVRHEIAASTRQAFADERDLRHIAAAYAWMERAQGPRAARVYVATNWLGSASRWAALTPLARLWPGRYAAARAHHRRYAALHRRGFRARSMPFGAATAA
jgi:N-acetylglucosaminyl-diphospho-decaprenol L-rhamnosyltransferase